jgi:hypothetical protein
MAIRTHLTAICSTAERVAGIRYHGLKRGFFDQVQSTDQQVFLQALQRHKKKCVMGGLHAFRQQDEHLNESLWSIKRSEPVAHLELLGMESLARR